MGEFRIDHATIAFRLALAEASEQEQARVDALMALWQRSVYAATWPSPNEAPRTLTNSHGETALPLFSGLDTLEVGADRFSWREPNGSIRFREMPAREALLYALTRQVNFVVLDVGFEHNVEFAREEFEPLVAQREPSLPNGSGSERHAAVLEAVRRNSRPPSAAPPPAAKAAVSRGSADSVRAKAASVAPKQAARSSASSAAWPHPQPSPEQHASVAAPERPSGAPTANAHAGASVSRSPAQVRQSPVPQRRTTAPWPQQPSEPASPPAPAKEPRQRQSTSSQPVQPSAAEPPPKPQSGAVLRQSSTPPVTSHAPQSAGPSAPRHPSPLPTVPPPRAAAEVRRTPPPVPEAARSRTPSSPGTKAPISDGPPSRPASELKLPEARRRTRDDEPTLAERPNRANTQRGLQASVSDSALEALSSELQGFPEVEWACVLLDESDVPLIALRIDPSFLNRVADITDVILDVGERQSVTLQVLLLNNQDQVKNARRNGRAFYPWSADPR